MKDLTKIGELTVIERQDATLTNGAGVGHTTSAIHEVLLSDGTTTYQCMYPDESAMDCTYTADKVSSVVAHTSRHGKRAIQRQLKETSAELSKMTTRAEQIKANRSAGAAKAVATKREKRGVPEVGDLNLAKQAQNVIIAFNTMQSAADEFQAVLIGYMRAAQTCTEKNIIDPQIIAKAQQYDELRKLLGK